MWSSSKYFSRLLGPLLLRPSCSTATGVRCHQLCNNLHSTSRLFGESSVRRTQKLKYSSAAGEFQRKGEEQQTASIRQQINESAAQKTPSPSVMSRVRKQQRKRRALLQAYEGTGPFFIGMPRAETIDLAAVINDPRIIKLYQATFVAEDSEETLHLVPKQKYSVNPNAVREFYLFSDGVVLFVNLDDTERAQILERLKPHEKMPYPEQLVEEETEKIQFHLVESRSGIKGDSIQLNATMYEKEGHQSNKAISERFAFSHGMALSVKIGIWESQLDTVAEPLLALAKDLRSGVVRVNQNDVLVKCGELHTLRQTINLDCELTSPDYYWDRPDLELLYKESLRHFETYRRLAMINKKIDYCEEMMHLLDGVLAHRHSSKLEWIIIILIVFEVVFECIHLADRQQLITFPISFTSAKNVPTVSGD